MKFVRLKKRLHVGNTIYYTDDVVNVEKHPEVLKALRSQEAKAVTRAPRDKMVRSNSVRKK